MPCAQRVDFVWTIGHSQSNSEGGAKHTQFWSMRKFDKQIRRRRACISGGTLCLRWGKEHPQAGDLSVGPSHCVTYNERSPQIPSHTTSCFWTSSGRCLLNVSSYWFWQRCNTCLVKYPRPSTCRLGSLHGTACAKPSRTPATSSNNSSRTIAFGFATQSGTGWLPQSSSTMSSLSASNWQTETFCHCGKTELRCKYFTAAVATCTGSAKPSCLRWDLLRNRNCCKPNTKGPSSKALWSKGCTLTAKHLCFLSPEPFSLNFRAQRAHISVSLRWQPLYWLRWWL